MSCHNIGEGMDSVVEKVISLLDDNKISTEAAREIIAACRKGVYWCDGNEDEAIECIRECRCGYCLKKIERDQKQLLFLWDLDFMSYKLFIDEDILDCGNIALASDGLCEDCFD